VPLRGQPIDVGSREQQMARATQRIAAQVITEEEENVGFRPSPAWSRANGFSRSAMRVQSLFLSFHREKRIRRDGRPAVVFICFIEGVGWEIRLLL
jgi:hypothetical protein